MRHLWSRPALRSAATPGATCTSPPSPARTTGTASPLGHYLDFSVDIVYRLAIYLAIGLLTPASPLLAPLIGNYSFKFDPAINLGRCGGARTSTESVATVGDDAKSRVPMLGYTVPYAVAKTTLTLWGLVILPLVT